MSSFYFYAALLSFVLGLGLATLYPLPPEGTLLGLVMSLGLAVIWRRTYATPSAPYVLLLSLMLCGLSLGLIRSELAAQQFGGADLKRALGDRVGHIFAVMPFEHRLGIEGINLARPALHAEVDHGLGPRREMRASRLKIHRTGAARSC